MDGGCLQLRIESIVIKSCRALSLSLSLCGNVIKKKIGRDALFASRDLFSFMVVFFSPLMQVFFLLHLKQFNV